MILVFLVPQPAGGSDYVISIEGEYEFRCQFLTEKNGKLTEKKRTDRENWDLTEKIGIDRENWD